MVSSAAAPDRASGAEHRVGFPAAAVGKHRNNNRAFQNHNTETAFGWSFCLTGMGIARVSGAARKFYYPYSRAVWPTRTAGAARSGVRRRGLGGGSAHSRFGQLK